jgi:DNA-binding NarL/FixJ family response regulator
MPRILIFDEHSVYRTGLRSLICVQMPRAEVLEASSLIQALSLIQDGALDLVLVGVDSMSGALLDPLKAARDAAPASRFAIMSASDTRADILASLAAGFHGFISKHQSETASWPPSTISCPGGFTCRGRSPKLVTLSAAVPAERRRRRSHARPIVSS